MQRRNGFLLAGLLGVVCVWNMPAQPLFSPQLSTESGESQDATDGWVRDNYGAVLNVVLHDRCSARHEATDPHWIVCVRINPGYETDLEYTLSVERRYDGTAFASITRAKSQSIYTQLYKLRKKRPTASASDLAKSIVVETQAGDQQRFPALQQFADEFEEIRFSPVLPDELMMDATEYVFLSKSSGNQMELVLGGPGSSAPRQPHPLLQWAESLRQMLASSFRTR